MSRPKNPIPLIGFTHEDYNKEFLLPHAVSIARASGFQEIAKGTCKCRACGGSISKGETRIAYRINLGAVFCKRVCVCDPLSNSALCSCPCPPDCPIHGNNAHLVVSSKQYIHARDCQCAA